MFSASVSAHFRLLNPGNQCYLNAVVYSLWLITCRVDSVFTLPKALRDNKAGFFKARQLFAYHVLGWRQPERQHDVTELILHMLPKLARSAVTGGVELRQHHNHQACIAALFPPSPNV